MALSIYVCVITFSVGKCALRIELRFDMLFAQFRVWVNEKWSSEFVVTKGNKGKTRSFVPHCKIINDVSCYSVMFLHTLPVHAGVQIMTEIGIWKTKLLLRSFSVCLEQDIVPRFFLVFLFFSHLRCTHFDIGVMTPYPFLISVGLRKKMGRQDGGGSWCGVVVVSDLGRVLCSVYGHLYCVLNDYRTIS